MSKDNRRFSYGLALLLANVTVVWARTPGPTPRANRLETYAVAADQLAAVPTGTGCSGSFTCEI
jgi:hypothetical protein